MITIHRDKRQIRVMHLRSDSPRLSCFLFGSTRLTCCWTLCTRFFHFLWSSFGSRIIASQPPQRPPPPALIPWNDQVRGPNQSPSGPARPTQAPTPFPSSDLFKPPPLPTQSHQQAPRLLERRKYTLYRPQTTDHK